jgi:hypothetical protein
MASTLKSIPGNKQLPGSETIEERLARLELRLQDGFARIGEAMDHGIEVDNWERLWIDLLREYEQLNDELDLAA